MKRNWWIGFSEGKPYIEEFIDNYGDSSGATIFPSRALAKKRFEDVRKVKLVFVTESKKVRLHDRTA